MVDLVGSGMVEIFSSHVDLSSIDLSRDVLEMVNWCWTALEGFLNFGESLLEGWGILER